VLFTPQGSKTALLLISDLTPYHFQFSEISGRLIDHLELTDFQLQSPQFEIQAQHFTMGYKLFNLFTQEKKIESIKADQLHIWFHTPHETSGANPINIINDALTVSPNFTLQTAQSALNALFPLPFLIENIQLTEATLHWKDAIHHIDQLTVTRAPQTLLNIEKIDYQGSWGRFHASLQEAVKLDWDLQLDPLPPKLSPLLKSVTTKGNIYLPHHQLEDAHNEVQFNFYAKELLLHKQVIKNLSIDAKGTLKSHQIFIQTVAWKN
jgi:hypothetical protein